MQLGPKITQLKYTDTHLVNAPGGKRMLAKLPKREAGERKEIKDILSSYHCKRCSKCCRGAFSIGETDPNYERIMKLVRERKKDFILENMGRGRSGSRYYDIGVPMKKNACGFLSWEGGEITHKTLIYSDGREGGYGAFSCEIYDARASVCMAYPLNVSWMHVKLEDGTRDGEGTIILDAGCPAIMELLDNGIGHITEEELSSLSRERGVHGESLLFSFPRSLREVKDRMAEVGKENRILVNEEGERVYPINAWEMFIKNGYGGY
jgi:Fe-S-cluster containining protein